jgi:hypothetical protein
MSIERRDELGTADMVAAGRRPSSEANPRSDTPGDVAPEDRHDDGVREDNVRRIDSAPRRGAAQAAGDDAGRPGALLPGDETGTLRQRWDTIQTGFVDEPRRAVEEADSLVAQTMKRVAEVFAEERASLERQWTRGEDVSTEDLRVALRRYRSFFDRLLAA